MSSSKVVTKGFERAKVPRLKCPHTSTPKTTSSVQEGLSETVGRVRGHPVVQREGRGPGEERPVCLVREEEKRKGLHYSNEGRGLISRKESDKQNET